MEKMIRYQKIVEALLPFQEKCRIATNIFVTLAKNMVRFKADDFWKKLIRKTIYNSYENKTAPTINVLYEKLKEISTGTHYELAYGRTTLQKADNRNVLIETPRIVAWRWEYLRQIEKYRSEGSLIVLLDET